MIIRRLFFCLYDSYKTLLSLNSFEKAGNLAFLLILSICPFLIILINIGGKLAFLFLQNDSFLNENINEIIDLIPDNIIDFLKPRIKEIISGPSTNLIRFSIISTIWTSSSVIEGLRTILNRANGFPCSANYIIRRLMSIVRFFTIIVIIVISITMKKLFPVFIDQIFYDGGIHSSYKIIIEILQKTVNFFILFICTASFYIIIPNVRMKFKYALPGTLILFIFASIITKIMAMYVIRFSTQINFIYGGLGSVIIVMLYFYLLSASFIFGAVFNKSFQNYFFNFDKNTIE